MFCSECGAVQPDGSKFCNACGAKLAGAEGVVPRYEVPIDERSRHEAPVEDRQRYEEPVQEKPRYESKVQENPRYDETDDREHGHSLKVGGVVAYIFATAVIAIAIFMIIINPFGKKPNIKDYDYSKFYKEHYGTDEYPY